MQTLNLTYCKLAPRRSVCQSNTFLYIYTYIPILYYRHICNKRIKMNNNQIQKSKIVRHTESYEKQKLYTCILNKYSVTHTKQPT